MRPRCSPRGLAPLLLGLLAVVCAGQERGWGRPRDAEPATPTPASESPAPEAPASESPAPEAPRPPGPPEGVLELALGAARREHPGLDEAALRARVAALAARWEARLRPGDDARARAAALAAVLFEDEGFRAVDDLTDPGALHLDSVLGTRRGYCLSLTLVALAMAEHLGEPLHAVAAPHHVFVRWDDGRDAVDVELTRGGALADPAAWRERLGDFLHDDSLYLRNLSGDELAGLLHHNLGFVELSRGRPDRALAELTRAGELAPTLPEVHRTLGVLHGEARRWDEAVAAFERALELYPGDVDALLNLALCLHARGDAEEAIEHAELALLLDPERERAVELLATWADEAAPLPPGARALDDPPEGLRPGLAAEYFIGTELRTPTLRRVDGTLDFDWRWDGPSRSVPRDGFSARWTGWFEAPVSGTYTFFVVVNDGLRLRVGEELVVDHWESSGSTSWTGTGDARLAAGWYPLRAEYFERRDTARLVVVVGVEGSEYPIELADHLFHEAP